MSATGYSSASERLAEVICKLSTQWRSVASYVAALRDQLQLRAGAQPGMVKLLTCSTPSYHTLSPPPPVALYAPSDALVPSYRMRIAVHERVRRPIDSGTRASVTLSYATSSMRLVYVSSETRSPARRLRTVLVECAVRGGGIRIVASVVRDGARPCAGLSRLRLDRREAEGDAHARERLVATREQRQLRRIVRSEVPPAISSSKEASKSRISSTCTCGRTTKVPTWWWRFDVSLRTPSATFAEPNRTEALGWTAKSKLSVPPPPRAARGRRRAAHAIEADEGGGREHLAAMRKQRTQSALLAHQRPLRSTRPAPAVKVPLQLLVGLRRSKPSLLDEVALHPQVLGELGADQRKVLPKAAAQVELCGRVALTLPKSWKPVPVRSS